MADTLKRQRKKPAKRSSNSNAKRSTPGAADQSGEGQESGESEGGVGIALHTRAQGPRPNEQILLLSLDILCALIRFSPHLFWIISMIARALSWGFMASELGRSRRSGMISNAVTALATQTRQITKDVSQARADSGKSSGAESSEERTEHQDQEPEIHVHVIDQQGPTKGALQGSTRSRHRGPLEYDKGGIEAGHGRVVAHR